MALPKGKDTEVPAIPSHQFYHRRLDHSLQLINYQ